MKLCALSCFERNTSRAPRYTALLRIIPPCEDTVRSALHRIASHRTVLNIKQCYGDIVYFVMYTFDSVVPNFIALCRISKIPCVLHYIALHRTTQNCEDAVRPVLHRTVSMASKYTAWHRIIPHGEDAVWRILRRIVSIARTLAIFLHANTARCCILQGFFSFCSASHYTALRGYCYVRCIVPHLPDRTKSHRIAPHHTPSHRIANIMLFVL